MPRPSTGTNLNIAQLEQILQDRRSEHHKLLKQRSGMQKKMNKVDREIAKLEGGMGIARRGSNGVRVRNEKSLPEAIQSVLQEAGKPMRVRDIVESVLASGYRSGSANFKSIVNQTLIKEKKRFGQVERGIYQLKK